jgi:acyl dehydratase
LEVNVSTQSSFLTEEMRRQAIGLAGPPSVHEVEKGAIIKFAEAIGDGNPVFNDEAAARRSPYGSLVAPPTYLRLASSVRPELPFDVPFDRRLDGGSDWEYFHPIRPGDRITTVSRIGDVVERTGRLGVMIITTTVTTYTNQFDEVVATQTTTGIRY